MSAERSFLGEADALIQALPDAANGFPATLQGREFILRGELFHINDPAQVLQLSPQNAGQTAFPRAVDAADNGIDFHIPVLPQIADTHTLRAL